MHNGTIAYKAFVICLVLFCGYMQWSPIVDFDYLWVNGHELYVGATDPHPTIGDAVVPILLQPLRATIEDIALHLPIVPAEQATAHIAPFSILRL